MAKIKATKSLHYRVDIEGCPRCEGDHVGEPQPDGNQLDATQYVPGSGSVMFTPLSNPEDRNDLWGFCDVAGQPILLSSEDVD